MRDQTILDLIESNTRREFLLLRQFEFLNTREQAFEQMLQSRWAVFLMWWNPVAFKRVWDDRQRALLAECEAEKKKAAGVVAVNTKIIKVGSNGHG